MDEQERQRLIKEEEKNTKRLRFLVDLTTSVLYQDHTLTLEEARTMVRNTEKAILAMFPDKQQTFDIVLRPRFERILHERWGAGVSGLVH
ncbi:MAG: hypothetical protein EHM61_19065 [Acidobacteria bacterium]|nr:MAG: hypothetical protein EHM61_19065 [Acidobacteriota bacterium]